MDGSRFDGLTLILSTAGSRRRALAGVVAGALGLVTVRDEQTAARKRKKRKKRKKKNSRSQCPAAQACGTRCCPAGDLCIDAFTGLCGPGAGTCPPGADVCGQPADASPCSSDPGGDPNGGCFCFITVRGFGFCGSTGGCTPTNDQCESDAECIAELQDVGARCVQGPACCAGGGTQCRRPCPT